MHKLMHNSTFRFLPQTAREKEASVEQNNEDAFDMNAPGPGSEELEI